MITDFGTSVLIRRSALDATVATGIYPKAVLEILLYKAMELQLDDGVRFIASVYEPEISVSLGLNDSGVQVRDALEKLVRWGWVRQWREGHYEVGYRSAGGGNIFYADAAYMNLEQRLVGVGSIREKVQITKSWLKEIEEARDASGI